jgi:ABC-2 type transport system ATP-binding protein
MLEIKGLYKTYGRTTVLQDIQLHLMPGDILGLLGKNGAGKTTLIHLIVDLIRAEEGSILVFGNKHTSLGAEDKRRIGLLGEELALTEELNAKEFLTFSGKLYGLSAAELRNRTQDLLAFFFPEKTDWKRPVGHFSAGMKKKLAFCAAVLHRPELLLLDEPFSGLDPLMARQMLSFISQYQNGRRCILISSHDLSYLAQLVNRIAVIDKSRICFDDSLKAFTENSRAQLDEALFKALQADTPEAPKMEWL